MKPIHLKSAQLAKLATSIALCISGLSLPFVTQAEMLTEAITGGKTNADIRFRYETVSQDNALKDATASTLRTRLGYKTAEYKGFTAFGEMEGISAVMGGDDYNSKKNGQSDYSVIADPSGYELNQATLSYSGIPGTAVILGRQRVILDNARFVGNVGWRQNEQTLDAAVIANKSLPDIIATYAYVDNVNTITGGDLNVAAHVINVSYAGLSIGKLSGYSYLFDITDAPALSQKTLGMRFSGTTDLTEGTKLLYTAEYASQSAYKDGATSISADYILGEFGATFSGITAKIGYEVLGSNGKSGIDAYGFSTPLATKHAFNGWADQFLKTPESGLQDTYLSVGGKVAGVKLLAVYHNYSADEGDADFGTELNLLAAKAFGKNYVAALKYASFSADDGSGKVDTDKLWFQGQIKF